MQKFDHLIHENTEIEDPIGWWEITITLPANVRTMI